jgi:hypothetical protein
MNSKETLIKKSLDQSGREPTSYSEAYKLKIKGLAVDQIALALSRRQNNFGLFYTADSIVIGLIRDEQGQRYDENPVYNPVGAIARIIDGRLINKDEGLYVQPFRDQNNGYQNALHRQLNAQDLIF